MPAPIPFRPAFRPWPLLGLLLAACDGEEPLEPPTLSVLTPTGGATVEAGTVPVSILVTDFTLVAPGEEARLAPAGGAEPSFSLPSWLSPIPAAYAHDEEGTPSGYCALTLDGAAAGELSSTQGALADVAAGPHTLVAELLYGDGDALDPAVTVTVEFTAE